MTVSHLSYGDTGINVPDEMTLEEALKYAEKHKETIPFPVNSVPAEGTLQLDHENCGFDNED